MNTDISEIDSEASGTEADKEKSGRPGSGLAVMAFVFAIAALAGTAWIWWQDKGTQDESTGKMFSEIARLENSDSELALKLQQIKSQVESLPSNDSSAEIAGLRSRLEASVAETGQLRQSINRQLALSQSLQAESEALKGRILSAESRLSGVASQELNVGVELDLAELDFLLRLASERLELFSDPLAANHALEMADIQLAAMDNPVYMGVRQGIAAARRDLSAVTQPDYFDISNQLEALRASILALPFRDDATVSVTVEEEGESGWWQKFKGVFSGLVTIRRSTKEENERISLEDKDYIRQQLWLQLEIAHLSLMRRDQKAFRNSLSRVQNTLAASFDQENSKYQAVKSSLAALNAIEVQPDVPDISAPWVALRQIRDARARSAPPAQLPEQRVQPLTETPTTETAASDPDKIPEQEPQLLTEAPSDYLPSGDPDDVREREAQTLIETTGTETAVIDQDEDPEQETQPDSVPSSDESQSGDEQG